MFDHRILAAFEERLLSFRGWAVLVLLVGGLGRDGVTGFLLSRCFLCSTLWYIGYSVHRGRISSTTNAQIRVSTWDLNRSTKGGCPIAAVPQVQATVRRRLERGRVAASA